MFKTNSRQHRSASAPTRMVAKVLSAAGLGPSKSTGGLASLESALGDHPNAHDTLASNQQPTDGGSPRGQTHLSFGAMRPPDLTGRTPTTAQGVSRPSQRRASSPIPVSHVGPLLGPVCGVATSNTTQELLATLLRAQTLACEGHPAQQIAAQFDIVQARKALLRRDLMQGPIERLAETPIERVFESILAEQLVQAMPAGLLAPMQQLSLWMAHNIEQLDNPRAERMMKGLIADLRKEHPRPWSAQQPLLGHLCDSHEPWQHKRVALTAFLNSNKTAGIDGLAAMVLLRSSFMGYKAAGLDTTLAPWLKDADRAYQALILPKKFAKPNDGAAAQVGADQMAGITNLGQSSPLRTDHLMVGVRATYRESVNLASRDAREAIGYGNPVASGTSGTTNMFLHAVSHYNAAPGAQRIDAAALTTLLATLTCYNGGHSIHEVLTAGHLLSALPHVDLPELVGYAPGHARGIFVDLATKYGAIDLAESSFTRLEAHFRKEPMR